MFKNLLFLLFLFVIVMSGSVIAGEGSREYQDNLWHELNLEYDIVIDENINIAIMIETEGINLIEQFGKFNFSMQLWSGVSNISEVYQLGDKNFSFIFQEGENNEARITQEGSGNRAVIRQNPSKEESKEDD